MLARRAPSVSACSSVLRSRADPYQENDVAKLEVSDIARSIKGRIREVEEQLKDHKALSDELERLKRALSRLEGGVRSRVDGRRGRQRPVTQPTTAPAPKDTSPVRSTNARAPRGENKKKILAALKDGPKAASEIANETGIKTGIVSASLSKLAKAGEVVKADRGYALPK
jgi:predicted Rossmann fold nucleotide-binding protein DprA/Smf involved in DNA uptake